jgi:hypothetical protein
MIPVVFYFTTEGTWDLAKVRPESGYAGVFFMAQAQAITHGRLDVERRDIPNECFDWKLRCYGYFGVTPSLLRLPFLPILQRLGTALTPLYLGTAIMLAYWGALRLLERSLVESTDPARPRALVLGYAIAGSLALGPGGTLLFLTRPGVYEEAQAWGTAFFVLTLERVWAWYRSRNPRPLIVAVLFGIAAANARPTAASACGVLGVVVAVLSCVGASPAVVEEAATGDPRLVVGPRRGGWRVAVAAACLALLPGLTAGGVFSLKFSTPVPGLRLNEQIPETPRWRAILLTNGDTTTGFRFTPTALVAYFRPDSVVRRQAWPFFDFRFPEEPILWVPPLPRGGAYVEPVASLTTTMPLPWALNVMVALWLAIRVGRLSPEQWIFAAGSLASAAAMILLTVTAVTITNRYLGDFFAISAVGVALGHRLVFALLRERPVLSGAVGLVALLLVAWSVLVTLALNTWLIFG